jgi:hypothetical protein
MSSTLEYRDQKVRSPCVRLRLSPAAPPQCGRGCTVRLVRHCTRILKRSDDGGLSHASYVYKNSLQVTSIDGPMKFSAQGTIDSLPAGSGRICFGKTPTDVESCPPNKKGQIAIEPNFAPGRMQPTTGRKGVRRLKSA